MEYTVRSTYTRTDSHLWRAADVAVTLLVSVLLVFLLLRFVLVPYEAGDCSAAELEKGDLVLVDAVSRFMRDYERGDLLRARLGESSEFLRLAALPGETYLVRNGKAYIDGSLLVESEYGGSWDGSAELSITVPEDCFLLLPDDRSGLTSLEAYIIPRPDVLGEARLIVSPLNRISLIY